MFLATKADRECGSSATRPCDWEGDPGVTFEDVEGREGTSRRKCRTLKDKYTGGRSHKRRPFLPSIVCRKFVSLRRTLHEGVISSYIVHREECEICAIMICGQIEHYMYKATKIPCLYNATTRHYPRTTTSPRSARYHIPPPLRKNLTRGQISGGYEDVYNTLAGPALVAPFPL